MKWFKRIVVVLVLLIGLVLVAAVLFVPPSYPPEAVVLEQIGRLQEANRLTQQDNWLRIDPPGGASGEAIVFYPGARVDYRACLPLWEQVSQAGHTVFLVEMPLDMAFLNLNAVNKIRARHPEFSTWHLAGHSLGGAMAGKYLAGGQREVASLILLGSYVSDADDISALPLRAISIREEFGLPGGQANADAARGNLPPDTEFLTVAGGNHAGFCRYGDQRRDGQATIPPEAQQQQTATWITAFLDVIP
jgi:hypothetical protein